MLNFVYLYLGVNLGVFMVCLDMDTSLDFKQAIKHRGRLYSNQEYAIILGIGGLLYFAALIKKFYDRTKF